MRKEEKRMANMLPTMLRWYREHAELTQAEVAEKLDVPPEVVQRDID